MHHRGRGVDQEVRAEAEWDGLKHSSAVHDEAEAEWDGQSYPTREVEAALVDEGVLLRQYLALRHLGFQPKFQHPRREARLSTRSSHPLRLAQGLGVLDVERVPLEFHERK